MIRNNVLFTSFLAFPRGIDKPIVLDYLLTIDRDQTYPGPTQPEDIVAKTAGVIPYDPSLYCRVDQFNGFLVVIRTDHA